MSESDHSNNVEEMDQEIQTQALIDDVEDSESENVLSSEITQAQPFSETQQPDEEEEENPNVSGEESLSDDPMGEEEEENVPVDAQLVDTDVDEEEEEESSSEFLPPPSPPKVKVSTLASPKEKQLIKQRSTGSLSNAVDEEQGLTCSHGRYFNSRLFRIHTLTLGENTGITFKKAFYVPKIHGLQLSHYFKALMRSVFKKKLSRTVAFLANTKVRRNGSGNLIRNFKIKRDSTTGKKIVLWNKAVVDLVKLSQTNINVLDVADGLREGDYVRDYFKSVVIPIGKSTTGKLSQLTQKELKSQNQKLLANTKKTPTINAEAL